METKNDESKKRTDFGYYEKRLCLLIMLSTIPNSLSTFQVLITQFTPPFHCDVENIYSGYENTSNISTGEFLNETLPYIQNENNELVRSSCTYYNISLKDFASFNTSDNNEVIKCSKYKFYGPTKSATMQFGMVCDQAHLKPMMTSLFMLGKLVGGLIGGAISDRFGRRPCFLIFTVYQHVVSILQSFAGDSISYGILMFFNGFGALVNYMAIAILGTEFLPPRLRHVALFLNTAGYAIGYMILPLLGYYIVDWRWFLRFSGFIGIFYLPYFWLLDETPYWLLSKGRVDEAKKSFIKSC